MCILFPIPNAGNTDEGTISTTESVESMMNNVLQTKNALNGKFMSYTGDELAW